MPLYWRALLAAVILTSTTLWMSPIATAASDWVAGGQPVVRSPLDDRRDNGNNGRNDNYPRSRAELIRQFDVDNDGDIDGNDGDLDGDGDVDVFDRDLDNDGQVNGSGYDLDNNNHIDGDDGDLDNDGDVDDNDRLIEQRAHGRRN